MEENISKLLQMAGGILIGVLLLALISYFFSSIGLWPTEEEDALSAEQLMAFNLEYEIYDKKGMYGVDVISCLNKAISNNEKYVEGNAFLTGTPYGDQFMIDAWVRINKELEESIEVYYYQNGVEKQLFADTVSVNGSPLTMSGAGFDIPNNKYYTGFENNTRVGNITNKSFGGDSLKENANTPNKATDYSGKELTGYYSILDNDGDNNLIKLMNLSRMTEQGSLEKRVVNRTGRNLENWSSVVWKTALSDFKKRRFKCDFIGYSQITGRVNEIHFSEI